MLEILLAIICIILIGIFWRQVLCVVLVGGFILLVLVAHKVLTDREVHPVNEKLYEVVPKEQLK